MRGSSNKDFSEGFLARNSNEVFLLSGSLRQGLGSQQTSTAKRRGF